MTFSPLRIFLVDISRTLVYLTEIYVVPTCFEDPLEWITLIVLCIRKRYYRKLDDIFEHNTLTYDTSSFVRQISKPGVSFWFILSNSREVFHTRTKRIILFFFREFFSLVDLNHSTNTFVQKG